MNYLDVFFRVRQIDSLPPLQRRDLLRQSVPRTALRADADQLCTKMTVEQVEELLNEQENPWWSIKIQSFKSKEHFPRHAGRYVRRPHIAQRRITYIGEGTVAPWYKDKAACLLFVQCSLEEFIDRLSIEFRLTSGNARFLG